MAVFLPICNDATYPKHIKILRSTHEVVVLHHRAAECGVMGPLTDLLPVVQALHVVLAQDSAVLRVVRLLHAL
jgi:hypothetical protein